VAGDLGEVVEQVMALANVPLAAWALLLGRDYDHSQLDMVHRQSR